MNRLIWLAALIINSTLTYGQRTEFSVQAGSGVFSFRGPGSADKTDFSVSDVSSIPNRLTNPYGRKSGFSYELTVQGQRVTKNGDIYGIRAGYQALTSQVSISRVVGGFFVNTTDNSYATLKNQYLNLSPFIGKRFGNDQISLDLTVGVDLGIGLSSRERSIIEQNPTSLTVSVAYRPLPALDIRPNLTVAGYHRAFGLSVGYAHGITSYGVSPSNTDTKAYTKLWRASLIYRFGHYRVG